jgi:predicted ArsR family transcriptional regulator
MLLWIRHVLQAMPLLVHEAELLWVTGAVEPATTREVAEHLPLDRQSAYVRLRSLARQGRVTRNRPESGRDPGGSSRWSLTARGREQVAGADLPPAEETEFQEYFEGRTYQIDTGMFLDELAVQGEEHAAEAASDETEAADVGWVSMSAFSEAMSFDRSTIRNHLHELREEGFVERDTERASHVHYWRLTDRGRARVTDADVRPYSTADDTEVTNGTNGTRPTIDDDRLSTELAVQGEDPVVLSVSGESGDLTNGTGSGADETGWVPSTALYDALPFSKMGIRKKLHRLKDDGLVEHDPDRGGQEHYWRLTEAGHERLTESDSERDATPAWLIYS